MGLFNRRNKQNNNNKNKSFYELAHEAEAHEDCLVLVAVPHGPYTPAESDLDEQELARVITEAIGGYFDSINEEAEIPFA